MPSAVDICNRALSDIGARVIANTLDDPTPQAMYCKQNYDPMRKLLLRAAPWNFSRKQIALTLLGNANTPIPFPWMFEYLYPADCIKFRYMLAIPQGWPFPQTPGGTPVTGDTPFFPYYPVSRRARFLVSSDADTNGNPRKVLLTNLCQALGVYSYDVTDPGQFDDAFTEALVAILAEKLIMPLTGNIGMKGGYMQIAKDRVMEARAADGNEGLPITDHQPDWITVRGLQADWYYSGFPPFGNGILGESWDSLNWGE